MSHDASDHLTDAEHARLSYLIERLGETRTAERLQICRTSVLRLLSRRPTRLGTLALARIGLSKTGA